MRSGEERRRWVQALLTMLAAICLVAWFPTGRAANRAFSQTSTTGVTDLKSQLERGLRARRPEEFAFIARVVNMVQRRALPIRVVKATFQWSRRRNSHFPFPYFQRSLRIEAAKMGIAVR